MLKPTNHDSNHGNSTEKFSGRSQDFAVFFEAKISIKPSKGTFTVRCFDTTAKPNTSHKRFITEPACLILSSRPTILLDEEIIAIPFDSLTIHFQHLEKARVSNLHIVTFAKTGDDAMAKPDLTVADTPLFCRFQSHSFRPNPPCFIQRQPMPITNRISFNNVRGDILGGLTAAVVALPLALALGIASGAGASAGLWGAILVGFSQLYLGGPPA